MNFNQFMRKIDGKEPLNETTDSSTLEAGAFDVQCILRIARRYGYLLRGLEERPEFPRGITLAWLRGISGDSTLGMYLISSYPPHYLSFLQIVFESGRRYSQGEQQEAIPPSPRDTQGEYYSGPTTSNNRDPILRDFIRPVGSATGNTQPRSEPPSNTQQWTARDYLMGQLVCETSSGQDSGIQGLRGQREGSECFPEDSGES